MSKKNVLSIDAWLKNKKPTTAKRDPSDSPTAVINLADRRAAIKSSERRRVTRTVMSQFIGVFVVLPDKGLQPVSLYDISSGGLAFDMAEEAGGFEMGDMVTVRIYLSHDTYFSFGVKITNFRAMEEKGTVRHGSVFRQNDESHKTLFHFIKFLESVSLVARKDNGDRIMGRVD